MPPLPPITLALAFSPCLPGGTMLDRGCAVELNDEQLASAVGGDILVLGDGALIRIAATQARDQVRVTAANTDTQNEIWWFTTGLDLMAKARDARVRQQQEGGATVSAARGDLGALLSLPQGQISSINTTSQGAATIDANIRFGDIRL